jgi:haloalkane dehalogenase
MSFSPTPLAKKFCQVNGRRLAYAEVGAGRPLVLLHGNPTSSYLWRNVVPHLAGSGRVIVPDLIGHGDSEKLPPGDEPGQYSFEVVYDYLDGLLTELGATSEVTMTLHDWGSALGFHWACSHPERVRGLAYMESIVAPFPSWNDWPEEARGIFQGFRSAKGEDMILNRNMFIERVLPSSILRKLTHQEMAEYRAPFVERDSRQTMLNWPRQIPIAGEPANVVAHVQQYANWLQQSSVPKLFINAEPGSILVGGQREFCRTWPNQKEVVVKGLHFVQEDSPDEIGRSVADWVAGLP